VPKTFGRHLAFDFRGIGVTVPAAPQASLARTDVCVSPVSLLV
jgi:hypothetical protein